LASNCISSLDHFAPVDQMQKRTFSSDFACPEAAGERFWHKQFWMGERLSGDEGFSP